MRENRKESTKNPYLEGQLAFLLERKTNPYSSRDGIMWQKGFDEEARNHQKRLEAKLSLW